MSRGITINLECILSSYDKSGTTSYEYSVVCMQWPREGSKIGGGGVSVLKSFNRCMHKKKLPNERGGG